MINGMDKMTVNDQELRGNREEIGLKLTFKQGKTSNFTLTRMSISASITPEPVKQFVYIYTLRRATGFHTRSLSLSEKV